jgi:DNA-binding GntR family transcriptional regulator
MDIGPDKWVASLTDLRPNVRPATMADRISDILRQQIIDGRLPPGRKLSEEDVASALDVSRNTLREAFRMLSYEGLLEYKVNRGVSVRVMTIEDVVETYRIRRMIELTVVRDLSYPLPEEDLDRLRAIVAEGDIAAEDGRLDDFATYSMRFHGALVALAGSRKMNELMKMVLAEQRLIFHVPADPVAIHGPFVAWNRRILELLEKAEPVEEELARYFETSEELLLAAFESMAAPEPEGVGAS